MSTALATHSHNTALTKIETPEDLQIVLTSARAQAMIVPLLPDGVKPAEVVAGMLLAVEKDPKLLKCTPASLVLAVAQAVQSGLTIGSTAHIVGFNTKVSAPGQQDRWESRATFIADYKGLARLMIGVGAVRGVEMRCVYENDYFEYSQGLVPVLEHRPVDKHCDRGALKGAYVILRFAFGHKQFEYMSVEAIDEIRQKYSKQWKLGPVPAWYAMKTVVRQASKLIPQEPRFAKLFRAVQADVEEEFGTGIPAGTDGLVADDVETPSSTEAVAAISAPVETPRAPGLTLADALLVPFPWRTPPKYAGKPLGDLSDNMLLVVEDAVKKEIADPAKGESPTRLRLRDAIALIQADRVARAHEDAKQIAAAPAEPSVEQLQAAGVAAADQVERDQLTAKLLELLDSPFVPVEISIALQADLRRGMSIDELRRNVETVGASVARDAAAAAEPEKAAPAKAPGKGGR